MSQFTQYTSGIQGVQGISEAGARIGQFAQQGLTGMSQSLAEGINAFQQNQALSQQADMEGQQVAAQLAYYHHIASQNPETAPLVGMLDSQISSLQKLPSASLSQKLGIINGAKASLSQFLPNFQLATTVATQRAQQDFGTAYKETGSTKMVDKQTDLFVKSQSFDPTKPFGANLEDFLSNAAELRQKEGANAVEGDDKLVPRYIEAYSKQMQDALARGQISQKVFSNFMDEAAAVRGDRLNQDLGIQGGIDEFLKANYDTAYQAPTASPEMSKKSKDIKEKVSALDSEISRVENIINTGSYTPKSVGQKSVEKSVGLAQSALDSYSEYSLGNYASFDKAMGKRITPEYFDGLIRKLDSMGPAAALSQFGQGILADIASKPLTAAEERMKSEAFKKYIEERDSGPASKGAFKKDSITGGSFLTSGKSPQEQLKELEEAKDKLVSQQSAIENGQQVSQGGAISGIAQQPPSPIGGGNLIAGSKTVQEEVPLTMEEKKQQVADWYKKSYGYIPSAFNQIWQSANPQPIVKVDQGTRTAYVQDEKGGWKQVDLPKPPSIEEQSLNRAIRYGDYDQNGNPVFEERISGSGILTNGVLRSADPKKEAPIFEDQIKATADVRRLVKELLPYYDSKTNALIPSKYKEVIPILNKLRAAIRPEIIGTGQQNEPERKQVIEAVGSPTDSLFNTLIGGERNKLLMLEKMQMEGLQDNKFGIKVKFMNDTETEANIRKTRQQARLQQR